jgi:FeS assembly SUF system regulator
MIRMSKMTDYALVLLAQLAREGAGATRTARELSERTHVPLPSVSKVLKELSHAGLLLSHRGSAGGYSLARPPEVLSVADVISALEGPVAMTECAESSGTCDLEPTCPMRSHWHTINRTIREALQRLKLADVTQPGPLPSTLVAAARTS